MFIPSFFGNYISIGFEASICIIALECLCLVLSDRYPSLRVAYIDEVEEPSTDRNKKNEKVYYSALVKASLAKAGDSTEPVQNLDQV